MKSKNRVRVVKPQQAEPWIEIIAEVQIAKWSQEERQSWVKLW